jgi:hypothetical protein
MHCVSRSEDNENDADALLEAAAERTQSVLRTDETTCFTPDWFLADVSITTTSYFKR